MSMNGRDLEAFAEQIIAGNLQARQDFVRLFMDENPDGSGYPAVLFALRMLWKRHGPVKGVAETCVQALDVACRTRRRDNLAVGGLLSLISLNDGLLGIDSVSRVFPELKNAEIVAEIITCTTSVARFSRC